MKRIKFDGMAYPNPGRRGIGVAFFVGENQVDQISKELESFGTNNEAEYEAVLHGVKRALELGWKEVIIEGDSKLVVDQLNGTTKVNKESLISLHASVTVELQKFDDYVIHWISRKSNAIADVLASNALGYDEDPYHEAKYSKKKMSDKVDINPDLLCPECSMVCTFRWKVFKNGERHIEKRCSVHGYVKYVVIIEPYLSLAAESKDEKNQSLDNFGL